MNSYSPYKAIREYKERWGESDLPPFIRGSNVDEVGKNCAECLEQGKRYSELFGVQENDPRLEY